MGSLELKDTITLMIFSDSFNRAVRGKEWYAFKKLEFIFVQIRKTYMMLKHNLTRQNSSLGPKIWHVLPNKNKETSNVLTAVGKLTAKEIFCCC